MNTKTIGIEEYIQYRKEIATGDLIQFSSFSILGWLIRKFSGYCNHSSQAIRFAEYQGLKQRRYILEALEHGIELSLISRRLEGYKGKVWWHPLKPEYQKYRRKIGALALSRIGIPYDYGSLFKNALGRVSGNANRLFCSEYVYLNCKDVGMPIKTEWQDKSPRPADMLNLGFWDQDGIIIHDSRNVIHGKDI